MSRHRVATLDECLVSLVAPHSYEAEQYRGLRHLVEQAHRTSALSVLAEQLDTSFHAIEELRTFTKIPVLVGIAGIAAHRDTVLRRRRFRLAAALAVLVVLLLAGGSHLAGRGNATLVAVLSPGGS